METKLNCYDIPFALVDKYLLRAGFFYGNYDRLLRQPSFNLEIDGNLWASVTASMKQDEPVYHELIYKLNKKQTTVCLVRTNNGGVPFVSSLEAAQMAGDHMYRLIENKTALYLHSRIDYGSNKSVECRKNISRQDERYYGIWKPKEMSEYLNITVEVIPDCSTKMNHHGL